MALEKAEPAAAAHLERLRRDAGLSRDAAGPDLGALLLPACREHVEALAEAARAYGEEGLGAPAIWFQEEHNLLGGLVGMAPLFLDLDVEDQGLTFRQSPPERLGDWQPDKLSGLDDWLVDDLWHVTPEGHLVVGLRAGATLDETYADDRMTAFVRDPVEREAGYVLRTRIHLLTPYVMTSAVLGYRRRDRNVRIHIEAGRRARPGEDPRAVGVHDSVYVWVDGLRPFDHVHPTGMVEGHYNLEGGTNAFDLTVLVDDCRVAVWVDDNPVGTWIDPEGIPVDGAIGFSRYSGAMRVGSPVVARLRPQTGNRRTLPAGPRPGRPQDTAARVGPEPPAAGHRGQPGRHRGVLGALGLRAQRPRDARAHPEAARAPVAPDPARPRPAPPRCGPGDRDPGPVARRVEGGGARSRRRGRGGPHPARRARRGRRAGHLGCPGHVGRRSVHPLRGSGGDRALLHRRAVARRVGQLGGVAAAHARLVANGLPALGSELVEDAAQGEDDGGTGALVLQQGEVLREEPPHRLLVVPRHGFHPPAQLGWDEGPGAVAG